MAKPNEPANWPTVAEFLAENQLQAELEKAGFTKDTQARLSDIFFQAVEERLSHDPFRQQLQELLDNYLPPSPFISDEAIDACELLGNRFNELQAAIEYVDTENEHLANELGERLKQKIAPERSLKKSTINETMFEPDPDNEDALFNESHQRHGMMATYLRAFGPE